MPLIKPPTTGDVASPEVRAIRAEGDEIAKRLAAMNSVKDSDAFRKAAPLDAHLFTLQMEVMQSYLHILTIRLARANDSANGRVNDEAPTLAKRPAFLTAN